MKKSIILLLITLFTGNLLTSCSFFQGNTATLWTNKAEIVAYIEVYNADRENNKIEVTYKPQPSIALMNEEHHPDMIVDTQLDSVSVFQDLSSLNKLFEDELLSEDIFYSGLLELGNYEETQYLLPVSFSIPTLMFNTVNIPGELNNFFITIEELKTYGGEFNTIEDESFITMGFSPDWSRDFLMLTTSLFGAEFRETAAGRLAWNKQKLEEAVTYNRDWIAEVNTSQELVTQFSEKYMYDPDYKLLNNGRILFSFTELQNYLQIPQEKRENLGFRWLAKGEKIRVRDDILFFGVAKKSKNRAVVDDFISWFFSLKTQQKLLEMSQFKRMRSFGISNGFSSLYEVNERIFPQFYPNLSGHVSPEEFLTYPHRLPIIWPEIKDQVLESWLLQSVREETGADFEEELETWMRQRPGQ